MFNLDKVHIILDEMVLNGCIVETNRARILAPLLILDKMSESWKVALLSNIDIANENMVIYLSTSIAQKNLEEHTLQNGVFSQRHFK